MGVDTKLEFGDNLKVVLNYLRFKPSNCELRLKTLMHNSDMKSTKNLLKQAARILSDDVSHFRQVILSSGGGEFPPSILEKKKLLQDIERLMKEAKTNPSP